MSKSDDVKKYSKGGKSPTSLNRSDSVEDYTDYHILSRSDTVVRNEKFAKMPNYHYKFNYLEFRQYANEMTQKKDELDLALKKINEIKDIPTLNRLLTEAQSIEIQGWNVIKPFLTDSQIKFIMGDSTLSLADVCPSTIDRIIRILTFKSKLSVDDVCPKQKLLEDDEVISIKRRYVKDAREFLDKKDILIKAILDRIEPSRNNGNHSTATILGITAVVGASAVAAHHILNHPESIRQFGNAFSNFLYSLKGRGFSIFAYNADKVTLAPSSNKASKSAASRCAVLDNEAIRPTVAGEAALLGISRKSGAATINSGVVREPGV